MITYNIQDLLIKTNYIIRNLYSDSQMNSFYNYWCLFEEKEIEIQELIGISLETILYSKYYWCTQYINRYNVLYGKDIGIEQQQYKIIEEMDQRMNEIDWELIQRIEEGKCG